MDLMIDTFSVACQYNLEPLRCKLEAMLALKIAEESVHSLLMLADAHHAMKVSALSVKNWYPNSLTQILLAEARMLQISHRK